jgi:hypothetical protein
MDKSAKAGSAGAQKGKSFPVSSNDNFTSQVFVDGKLVSGSGSSANNVSRTVSYASKHTHIGDNFSNQTFINGKLVSGSGHPVSQKVVYSHRHIGDNFSNQKFL